AAGGGAAAGPATGAAAAGAACSARAVTAHAARVRPTKQLALRMCPLSLYCPVLTATVSSIDAVLGKIKEAVLGGVAAFNQLHEPRTQGGEVLVHRDHTRPRRAVLQ